MKRKTKIILAILAILAILVILGVLPLLKSSTTNSEPCRLNLPEGTTYEALCDSLHANGILSTGLKTKLFNFQFSILNSKVRPGSYLIEPHMSEFSLVRKLRNGQQDPIRLTIGKFRSPRQLNDYLNSKLMHNDFSIPLDSFHLILQDTYEFFWTVTPEQFLQRMEDEYKQYGLTPSPSPKGEGSGMQSREKQAEKIAQQYHLLPSPHGEGSGVRLIIILASIVEEETNNNAEKPLIASVYLNRLKRGMPLQADPTVKYAVGDFTLRRILNKHLAVDSPFNTYLHTGLPPAPICLPSKASIDAVINAKETNYLYFCASNQMDGTHRFAATLDEHQRNAAAFHRALNKRGIK